MMYANVNDFLRDYGMYLAIGVAVLIVVVAAVILLSYYLRKGRKPEKKIASKSEYLAALGGEGNILEKELRGSRIALRLADYSKLDKEKLKEAGVDGFIMMSDKLTLVIKGSAEEAYKVIFG